MRVEARIATDLKVRIVTNGHTRSEFLIDISLGGAFVRSALPLQVGTDVELHLRPPRTLLGFTLKGRVAWHRMTGKDTGYGVAFIAPDSAKLTKLLARLT